MFITATALAAFSDGTVTLDLLLFANLVLNPPAEVAYPLGNEPFLAAGATGHVDRGPS